jgi:F0F1-type ATP synthase membrane subunit b/b'
MAETVRNTSVRADLQMARYAVQDLASLQLAIRQLVEQMREEATDIFNMGVRELPEERFDYLNFPRW